MSSIPLSDDEREMFEYATRPAATVDDRLVYADWLEDHGDNRSEYIRFEILLSRLPKSDPTYRRTKHRFRQMRKRLDPNWTKAVSLATVLACGASPAEKSEGIFEVECPLRWNKLKTTDDPGVRFCDVCEQHVYLLDGPAGACVAIPLWEKPSPKHERPDQREPRVRRMGKISPRGASVLARLRELAERRAKYPSQARRRNHD